MSHIYDALNKSQGDPPPKDAPPPSEEKSHGPLVPKNRITGELLGEPNKAFLRELNPLRENVEVMLGRTARRVVAFMGAVPGEGATTLGLHFAFLIARVADKRVLLIDADMARSSLSLSDAMGRRKGLTEVLGSRTDLEEVILSTEEPKLHFLPAGLDQVHHVEAVSSGPLKPLFDHLGKVYDFVVVDNAPVLEHPEAPLIGAASDGVVLVVRANRTRREIAQRAIAALNYARCRILGTVLNAHQASLPSFLRERV